MPPSLRSGAKPGLKMIRNLVNVERTLSPPERPVTASRLHSDKPADDPAQSLPDSQTKAHSAYMTATLDASTTTPTTFIPRISARFKFGRRYACYYPGCKFSRATLAELGRHFSSKVSAHPGTPWDKKLAVEIYMEDPNTTVEDDSKRYDDSEQRNFVDNLVSNPIIPVAKGPSAKAHYPSDTSSKLVPQVTLESSTSKGLESAKVEVTAKSKARGPKLGLFQDVIHSSPRLAKKRQRDSLVQGEEDMYLHIGDDEGESRAKRPRSSNIPLHESTSPAFALPKTSVSGVTHSAASQEAIPAPGKYNAAGQERAYTRNQEHCGFAYSHTPFLEDELRSVIARQAGEIRSSNEIVARARKLAVQCEEKCEELAAMENEKDVEIANLLRNVSALAEALVKERQAAREGYQDLRVQNQVLTNVKEEQAGRLAALAKADASQKARIAQLESSAKTLTTPVSKLEGSTGLKAKRISSSSDSSTAEALIEEQVSPSEEVNGVTGNGGEHVAVTEECAG